jgi:hypothetical protein
LGNDEIRHGAGTPRMRRMSRARSWKPIANSIVAAGMARTRIGGSWGHVPAISSIIIKNQAKDKFQWNQSSCLLSVNFLCHNSFDTYVCTLRTDYSALGILLPEAVETDKVLDNRDRTQQRSANTERSVGGELISCQAIPHAKVKSNGHKDAVENDERPEPENRLLSRAQRVLQRRRSSEVGVIVCDLCVGISGVERVVDVWRDRSAGIRTGVHRCCAVVHVAHAISAGNVEGAICCVRCRRSRRRCHLRRRRA